MTYFPDWGAAIGVSLLAFAALCVIAAFLLLVWLTTR